MTTTVLLSRASRPYELSVVRIRPHMRFLVRVHSLELDRRLAAGASPDSSAQLSLRAQQLQSSTTRRRLASGFRARLAVARRQPHPINRRIPLARAEIDRCSELIGELADRLDSAEPVDSRGIARAHVLLSEGNGPLYVKAVAGTLGPTLRRTIEELEPATPPAD